MHRAAHILGNEAGEDASKVQRRFDGLVAAITRHRAKAGSLAGAIEHFGKVTRSYRPGLFHCYAVPDLPRTDNDLEQLFGSQRYHERRATGRKMASPAIGNCSPHPTPCKCLSEKDFPEEGFLAVGSIESDAK